MLFTGCVCSSAWRRGWTGVCSLRPCCVVPGPRRCFSCPIWWILFAGSSSGTRLLCGGLSLGSTDFPGWNMSRLLRCLLSPLVFYGSIRIFCNGSWLFRSLMNFDTAALSYCRFEPHRYSIFLSAISLLIKPSDIAPMLYLYIPSLCKLYRYYYVELILQDLLCLLFSQMSIGSFCNT